MYICIYTFFLRAQCQGFSSFTGFEFRVRVFRVERAQGSEGLRGFSKEFFYSSCHLGPMR